MYKPNPDEHCPAPQQWISKDKVVTVSRCGPIETHTEVDRNTGNVTTKTYLKTTP